MQSAGIVPTIYSSSGLQESSRSSTPVIFFPNVKSGERFFDFFTSNIRNRNTRAAYFVAAKLFSAWCETRGVFDLVKVRPVDVSSYVEYTAEKKSRPTAKQHLAALRHLFDWMVIGQIIEHNPAHAVRGPKHVVSKGKTLILSAEQARELLDSIDASTLVGKRDRALIALMTYGFARVSAAVNMRVEDYYILGRRGKVRLHEKGGKFHEIPCHHNLDSYLEEYIATAGLAANPKGPLFPRSHGSENHLTQEPMSRHASYKMVRRRAQAIGISVKIGNHSFRGTGITTYRKNGGSLEVAQRMAAHASPETTMLYDHSDDEISLDEIERIVL
jgi:integrase/recombinase XerD